MALRRRRQEGDGIPSGVRVPPELLFPGDPLWEDQKAAERWMKSQGLDLGYFFNDSAATRRRNAIHAWARANGVVNERWPKFPHAGNLAALGIEGNWDRDVLDDFLRRFTK